jgi:hypothetical protein
MNSIPNFGTSTILVTFTATSGFVDPDDGGHPNTTAAFRFLYRDSILTVGMSTTCQTMQQVGQGCTIAAALAVLPGTLT